MAGRSRGALRVHDHGETTADVTEGTPAGIGINWERCRYDWSEPGRVIATVIDSNVYAMPGSSWRITATATEPGSQVEMTWIRTFRHNPRGLFFGTLFRDRRQADLRSLCTSSDRQPGE